ncbi:hypothetical protein S7711_09886 [Stachybotrys chartarum IBT 7711]|uniref:Zn(2)-C6 fungal-type domain-containing protein n=1 Tax=Stachybotrys chartarum (strain CBS 109288 / IBT 7711) TaxID=1280523 RepID=A0A084B650_STACB|nr:hypothetical protein S7711_09886 [Stachybotrys chartarum IBT 7711]
MPGQRSRHGCDECRKRRRKCDEAKPACSQCGRYKRTCVYSLKLVWGGRKGNKSWLAEADACQAGNATQKTNDKISTSQVLSLKTTPSPQSQENWFLIPQQLPNGITLPPRYRRLLSYFSEEILASLSTHPSIHHDLRQGLIPVMLGSPPLLSASLALSASGLLSRTITEIDGVDTTRVIEHLQTSGLSLLSTSLQTEQNNENYEVLLVTCLIWCLADVFAARQGVSSWRVHLKGVKAILDDKYAEGRIFMTSGPTRSALRHLYLLYLSLQTLPHLSSTNLSDPALSVWNRRGGDSNDGDPRIDGFLGYDAAILDILQQINQVSSSNHEGSMVTQNADRLIRKVESMVHRDKRRSPDVSISTLLQPQASRDFDFCHKSFQQATLIQLYRLQQAPSSSNRVQAAVKSISGMIDSMTQGLPCHTWVAMSMPLFTIGCEAFDDEQQEYVRDKIQKLDTCLGSLHVRIVRQALEDIWRFRKELQDHDGKLCASELLDKVQYNVVLF